MDLIQKMLESKNKLIVAAANDMSLFKGLKHSKKDLETFLMHTIALIRYFPSNKHDFDTVACTSNTRFIKVFSALKDSQKKKLLTSKNGGLNSKDTGSVLSYDLVKNKYCTITLSRWEIVSFIAITEENIEILDKMANELLKRKVEHDLDK